MVEPATTWADQVVAALAARGPTPLDHEVRVDLVLGPKDAAETVPLVLGPSGVHRAAEPWTAADLVVRLEADAVAALASGQLASPDVLRSGHVRVRGDASILVELLGWLSATS
ncbi:MAG: hypothetical protein ACP5OV_00655 [Acidimicrobiales bacterium]